MGVLDGIVWMLSVWGIVFAPMLITVGAVYLWRFWIDRRNRRSPLTTELLRTPGYGLQQQIEDLRFDLAGIFMMTMVMPLMLYSFHLWARLNQPNGVHPANVSVPVIVVGIAAFVYLLVKLVRLLQRLRRFREALDGELATAQCLEPVIAGGGQVFHDIQADGFNIDHVVVAPGGVFAVETKHRLKPTDGDPKAAAKVRFDGQALQFPGWVDTKSVDQARRQALWLSKFLSKATGETVEAKPVLALPGWFVERTGRSDVAVVNPKNTGFMLTSKDGLLLAEDARRRICYQLEQRCQECEDARSRRGR